MEYLYGFLILIGFAAISTTGAAILGNLLTVIYICLSVYLGTNFIILGIAGLLGNLFNIFMSAKYIRQHGVMSQAPLKGILASQWYVFGFLLTILFEYVFGLTIDESTIWYYYAGNIVIWLLIQKPFKKEIQQSLNDFFESVIKVDIIDKYNDDPKWALYLHFNDGFKDWSKTTKGSYRAKHPIDDLTYGFYTKEEAMNYAKRNFINAEFEE